MQDITRIIFASILIVIGLILLWTYAKELKNELSGAEHMTRIYNMGDGIMALNGNQIVPDMTYTYFDGEEEESCDLCPNPTLCPECPQSGIGKLFDKIKETFSGSQQYSTINKTIKPDVIYYGEATPGRMSGVNKTDIISLGRPDLNKTSEANFDAVYGTTSSNLGQIKYERMENQTAPWIDPVTTPTDDFDPDYWQARERSGASYNKYSGRSNPAQFMSREDMSGGLYEDDSMRNAASIEGKHKTICSMPSHNDALDLLYKNVMGIDIDAEPAPEEHEHIGINDYVYKDM